MKVGSTCRQRKPLSAFYKQKGGAQGRRGRCKEYRAAERASWARERKYKRAGDVPDDPWVGWAGPQPLAEASYSQSGSGVGSASEQSTTSLLRSIASPSARARLSFSDSARARFRETMYAR
jgi:hypothetical protein